MGYVLILVFTILNLAESMTVRAYAKRYESGGMLMNAIISLFAALFYLISDFIGAGTRGLNIPTEMIPLAVINSILYAVGFYSAFLAFKVGPYGLTRLVSNFSLLFPIFYGMFFRDEPTWVLTYIGIAMVFAAMVMINVGDKKKKDEKSEGEISFKWVVFALTTVVSNGFIAILLKAQQDKFNNACSNEFQMLSLLGSFLLLTVIGFAVDRDKLGPVIKNGSLYGAVAGLINGGKNFSMIAVYWLLDNVSSVSPIKAGLGMVAAFLTALFIYKEKYSPVQVIGVLLGASAVVLLGIPIPS